MLAQAAPIVLIPTPEQRERFMEVGQQRHDIARRKGYKKKQGEDRKLEFDTGGAVAEGMAAQWAGVPYRPLRPGEPDLGGDIAEDVFVKSTTLKDGHLIIQAHNRDHAAYIFLTDSLGTPTIQGWTWGWFIKRNATRREGSEFKRAGYWLYIDKLFRAEPRMRLLRFMTQWAAANGRN